MDNNNNRVLVIGISGKLGSGKDHIAKEVIGNYLASLGIPYMHMAFGDALKVHLMTTHGVPFNELYVKKTAYSRQMLQNVGMELRETDDKIWIKQIDAWISVYSGMRNVRVILISDVRFPIEYEYIKKRGGLVFRIVAPKRTMCKMNEENGGGIVKGVCGGHISEIALDTYDELAFDAVLENDDATNEQLLAKIKPIIDCKMFLFT